MIDFPRLIRAQKALVRIATGQVPDGWTRFKITTRPTADSFQVTIDGPTLIAPDDELYAPLREILSIHADAGHPLASFTYEFTKEPDGAWNGGGEFEYVS